MQIVIPTVFREKENYITHMLENMINKDHTCLSNILNFYLGSAENAVKLKSDIYNVIALHTGKFRIIPLTLFEWSLIEDKTIHVRFNMNFMRCLTATNFEEDILYLEDDIEFSQNWYMKLNTYIQQLDEEYQGKYILSLYSPFEFKHNRLVDKIQPGHWYGTQGVYLKKEIQQGFYNKILTDGFMNYRHMADLLLDEYAKENNIPILCLTKSLIQHIGKESTGLGHFHWTNNFE